ncbi:MAG: type II toxin-antitoxin system HicB family antitoxin [Nanoarchaeota archaeon]
MERKLSAVVSKDGKHYVARGVEIELASQGKTSKEALSNLKEAFELWLEHAEPEELKPLNKASKPILSQVAAAV